jgi:hypothetical protein
VIAGIYRSIVFLLTISRNHPRYANDLHIEIRIIPATTRGLPIEDADVACMALALNLPCSYIYTMVPCARRSGADVYEKVWREVVFRLVHGDPGEPDDLVQDRPTLPHRDGQRVPQTWLREEGT